MNRKTLQGVALCLALGLGAHAPAHASLISALVELMTKEGAVVEKAAAQAASKGAATGAAVTGAEAAGAKAAAHTGEDIAHASGLGKAVPDDVASMMHGTGKTLSDVPDAGAKAWLSKPLDKLQKTDADQMVTDYVKLLEGKATQGPAKAGAQAATKAPTAQMNNPPETVPWYAVQLLVRAAHLGSRWASKELNRVCQNNQAAASNGAACKTPVASR
ncbi:MAG: hypothetical protein EBR49_02425 [Betaproteobacteria bacterium]|nr:hypothetical protein [Betaproteobacteria bacterium]